MYLLGQNDSTDFWTGAEKLPNVTYFRWTDGNTVDVHVRNQSKHTILINVHLTFNA